MTAVCKSSKLKACQVDRDQESAAAVGAEAKNPMVGSHHSQRVSAHLPAPRVKFRPAQFHIVASQLPCVGRKLRPQQAWVHSVGNRGCIYWPFSGPSEPPCRTAAIDRSCPICAARGRSGSSVTAGKPV